MIRRREPSEDNNETSNIMVGHHIYEIDAIGVHPTKALIVDVQKISLKISKGLA